MLEATGCLLSALLCSQLMFDLEQCATGPLHTGHPHLSSGESTCPWPAWLEERSSENTVLSGRGGHCRNPAQVACHCLGGSFGKRSCHFCSSGLAGEAAHLVAAGLLEDFYYYENRAIC
jgi:hypothetical protein